MRHFEQIYYIFALICSNNFNLLYKALSSVTHIKSGGALASIC